MAKTAKAVYPNAVWRSAEEREAWYRGMAEAERRERAGESWDSALGKWITRRVHKVGDTRITTRSEPSAHEVERQRVAALKAAGKVWKGKRLGWVKP